MKKGKQSITKVALVTDGKCGKVPATQIIKFHRRYDLRPVIFTGLFL